MVTNGTFINPFMYPMGLPLFAMEAASAAAGIPPILADASVFNSTEALGPIESTKILAPPSFTDVQANPIRLYPKPEPRLGTDRIGAYLPPLKWRFDPVTPRQARERIVQPPAEPALAQETHAPLEINLIRGDIPPPHLLESPRDISVKFMFNLDYYGVIQKEMPETIHILATKDSLIHIRSKKAFIVFQYADRSLIVVGDWKDGVKCSAHDIIREGMYALLRASGIDPVKDPVHKLLEPERGYIMPESGNMYVLYGFTANPHEPLYGLAAHLVDESKRRLTSKARYVSSVFEELGIEVEIKGLDFSPEGKRARFR